MEIKISKKLTWLACWFVILAVTVFATCINYKFYWAYLFLFILSLIAGVLFDFLFCKWVHFNWTSLEERKYSFDEYKKDDQVNFIKQRSTFKNYVTYLAYRYEMNDSDWKNFFWNNFLKYLLFSLLNIIVYLVVLLAGWIIQYKDFRIEWYPLIALSGAFIPYFFHRAYYYTIRIPALKQGVYVYDANADKVIDDCREIESILNVEGDEIPGWLLNKKAIFDDNQRRVITSGFQIPFIKETWSYRQILDIIFYWNNQTENSESYYKKYWPSIDLFTGNDKLVKTCWAVKIETGAAYRGIEVKTEKILNFSLKEFNEEKVKVNGLMTIERKT